jgi:hypothetical protein
MMLSFLLLLAAAEPYFLGLGLDNSLLPMQAAYLLTAVKRVPNRSADVSLTVGCLFVQLDVTMTNNMGGKSLD